MICSCLICVVWSCITTNDMLHSTDSYSVLCLQIDDRSRTYNLLDPSKKHCLVMLHLRFMLTVYYIVYGTCITVERSQILPNNLVLLEISIFWDSGSLQILNSKRPSYIFVVGNVRTRCLLDSCLVCVVWSWYSLLSIC